MLLGALLTANQTVSNRLAVQDGRQSLTYRTLTLLSRVLRDVVLRETDEPRVGVMLPASCVFPAAFFGILWAGRTAVPLNFLLSKEELSPIVEDAGLDRILTVRHFEELSSHLPVQAVFLDDLPLKRRTLLAGWKHLPSAPAVNPQDTAVILYTSGTTGVPKGVELSQGNLLSNSRDALSVLGLQGRHRLLNLLPPFHVFGLTAGVLIPVLGQCSVYAMQRFHPIGAVRAVQEHRVDAMMVIPSMYAAMLRVKSATPDSFRSLKWAVSGGEPLTENLRLSFRERFGVDLLQGYGLTETSPVLTLNTPQSFRHGSVGRAIPNVVIRIIQRDGGRGRDGGLEHNGSSKYEDGQECAVNEVGEICARGPGIMKGYYRRQRETQEVIDADGWFRTGDLGKIDKDGFLFITGRVKDLLIVGGENVSSREIEIALEEHPSVAQAAVIGMPDEMRGEVPVAFVIPGDNTELEESELRQFAKKRLAGFKVPRRIIIRTELPTGPTGKLLKRQLKDIASSL